MSQNNTDIKLRRSTNTFDELKDQQLSFGEPFFVDGTNGSGVYCGPGSGNSYLVLGRKQAVNNDTDAVLLENSPVIKCLNKERADNMLFKTTSGLIIDEKGNEIGATQVNATSISEMDLSATDPTKYYILCQPENGKTVKKFALGKNGIYVTANGVMHGAAWNDYAENRKIIGPAKPGQVVCDFEDSVVISNERLQPCAYVISDTYGYTLGNDEPFTVPVAVAGRVLTYIKEKDVKVGDCVCADKDGKASVMTRDEVINYPDRILGVVSEIPHYDTWKDKVKVDGRVWIKIR